MPTYHPVHPEAKELAINLGMDSLTLEALLSWAARKNPMALIGGFNVDVVIVAAAWALSCEDDLTHAQVQEKIQSIIEVYMSGLV